METLMPVTVSGECKICVAVAGLTHDWRCPVRGALLYELDQ